MCPMELLRCPPVASLNLHHRLVRFFDVKVHPLHHYRHYQQRHHHNQHHHESKREVDDDNNNNNIIIIIFGMLCHVMKLISRHSAV